MKVSSPRFHGTNLQLACPYKSRVNNCFLICVRFTREINFLIVFRIYKIMPVKRLLKPTYFLWKYLVVHCEMNFNVKVNIFKHDDFQFIKFLLFSNLSIQLRFNQFLHGYVCIKCSMTNLINCALEYTCTYVCITRFYTLVQN